MVHGVKVSTKRSIMTQTETAAKKTAAKKTSAVKVKVDAKVTTAPAPKKAAKPAAKKKSSGLAFPFTGGSGRGWRIASGRGSALTAQDQVRAFYATAHRAFEGGGVPVRGVEVGGVVPGQKEAGHGGDVAGAR